MATELFTKALGGSGWAITEAVPVQTDAEQFTEVLGGSGWVVTEKAPATGAFPGSSVVFLPAGTGAVAGTSQGQLQKTVFLSSYSSQANFDAAVLALGNTDQIGLPANVVIGPQPMTTGGYPITIKSANPLAGDFNFAVNDTLSNGDNDTVFSWGYNAAVGGGRRDVTEPAWFYSIESNWNPGGSNVMESHMQGINTDGTSFRNMTWSVNRATKAISAIFNVDTFAVQDRTQVNQAFVFMGMSPTAGSFRVNTGSTIAASFNNVPWLLQLNAAANAYINLPYIDSSNRVISEPAFYTNAKMGVGTSPDGSYFLFINATAGLAARFHTVNTSTNPTVGNPTFYLNNTDTTNGNFTSFAFLDNGSGTMTSVIAGHVDVHSASSQGSLRFYTRDGTTLAERWRINPVGGFVAAANQRISHGVTALATNATEGFLMVQSCAGTPTGVPATIPTGQIPMVYDTTANKIWFYNGGTWRGVLVA